MKRGPANVVARIALIAITIAFFVAWAAPHAGAEAPQPEPFDVIYMVLESPRCKNCHPVGDAPLQGDASFPHAMNISRKSADSGLACTACHGQKNTSFVHGPPGAPNWRLPAADMPLVFEGKSPHDLCEQLRDEARNGGKSLADLEHHMDHDPFVMWGWSPGPGRTVPPRTHDELMVAVRAWVRAGGRCP